MKIKKLNLLKKLIHEGSYPFFTDSYLIEQIETGEDLINIAIRLCLEKSGIEEMKLGDVTIKSPRQHFLNVISELRGKMVDENLRVVTRPVKFRTMGRADKRDED